MAFTWPADSSTLKAGSGKGYTQVNRGMSVQRRTLSSQLLEGGVAWLQRVACLLVVLGLDGVEEVLRQLGGLGKSLGDGGGDVDVQRVALLDPRPLPAQRDVCAVSVAMCCM